MEKQGMRHSLVEDVESELKKDADDIDPGFIDRRIDELSALEGLSPPKLSDEQLSAAARTVRARAAWRRRNRLAKRALKNRFIRRAVRGVMAACGAFLFFFSVNYLSALITGSCLPSKAGITICRGTQFCRCDIAKTEKTGHPE
jgi:hypothetical protein